MNQILQKPIQMCSKHSSRKIKVIKVNDISNQQDESLFYCSVCANQDLKFKGANYLLISQIMEEGETNIIQKWPPINDSSIIDKLIQFTSDSNSIHSFIGQINQRFIKVKDEFIRRIDLCQKKMISRELELSQVKEQIIKQYQEISQILKLKNIFVKSDENNNENIEESYSQFIIEVQLQKENNNKLLSNLVEICQETQETFNAEYLDFIQNSIFDFIEEINYVNENQSKSIKQSLNSSQVMKLISNKSNFCSENFLFEINTILEKINPLLKRIQIENIHEQNKSPIDFSRLNEIRLNVIKDFTDHQTHIEENQEYSLQIQNTLEFQYMESIIDSNVNFMNLPFRKDLKQYLVDSFSLLKKIKFENSTTDTTRYDTFRKLSLPEIEDIYLLIKKRQELQGQNEYNKSETNLIKNQIQFILYNVLDTNLWFQKYPIFDLMKKVGTKDILSTIKFTKNSENDGEAWLDIYKNHQVFIKRDYSKSQWMSCESNINLDKNAKYIFRFQIQNLREDNLELTIGLSCEYNKRYGFSNKNINLLLHTENNKIKMKEGCGIEKIIKGNKFKLSKENEIEMRVYLQNSQLEILDYPNYNYKVALGDQFQSYLQTKDSVKLIIGLNKDKIKVTLNNAFILTDFPN